MIHDAIRTANPFPYTPKFMFCRSFIVDIKGISGRLEMCKNILMDKSLVRSTNKVTFSFLVAHKYENGIVRKNTL